MHHQTSQTRPLLLALCLGLVAAGPLRAQSHSKAPLAGLWKLNNELSQRFEDKLEDARRPGAYTGAAGGRPRGGGGGRHGGEGGGGRRDPREGEGRGQEGQEMANLIHPILQVLIRQDDSTVAISDIAGQMVTFYTDGRKVKEPQLVGADMQTTARWKDGKLEVERKQDKGGTLKETWDVDPVGKRLILTIKLSAPSLARSLEFRRVYDPAPAS